MKKDHETIEICFAIHADYNFTDVLLKSDYTDIYKNLFSNLYSSSNIPFTLALSGGFLDWAQRYNSHFFDVISEMLDRKQIEILGNAFYEPFISTIPSSDLIGQIEHMTDTLRRHFYKNKRPRGMYLPYFAWNPNSIHILKKCGFDYCLLDTRFFSNSGLKRLSPVCMEDSGKIIFGIPATFEFENTDLTPSAFYEIIKTYNNSNSDTVLVIFFSPDTALRLLDKGLSNKSWMDDFFDILSNGDGNINIINSGQILKNKLIYQKGFITSNGVFSNQPINSSVKQLLVNKKNIYLMYAKMNYVHTIVNQIRGDKSRKKNALLDLWRAEQGVLFNIDGKYEKYNRELRNICYRNLLLAERQTRIPGEFINTLGTLDFDLDGVKEFISQRNNVNMYVHSLGGKIFELDVFTAYKNYADISMEDTGLFIDHLVNANELDSIKNGDFSSAISKPVFSNNLYQDIKLDRRKYSLSLKTDGSFRSFNQSISLKKRYNFNDKGAAVQYIIKNESLFSLVAYFMVEIDIAVSPLSPKKSKINIYSNEKKIEASFENNQFDQVSWMQIDEPEGKSLFTIESNEPTSLILLPIYEKSTDAQNPIVGIRNLFYWKLDLASEHNTEKMLFFKVDAKKSSYKCRASTT